MRGQNQELLNVKLDPYRFTLFSNYSDNYDRDRLREIKDMKAHKRRR